jgi:iron complex outermembrane receptor protein
VNDALTLFGKVGTSQGNGNNADQDVAEWNVRTPARLLRSTAWARAARLVRCRAVTRRNPAGTPLGQQLGWIFGDQNVHVKDKENWAQVDGDYNLPSGHAHADQVRCAALPGPQPQLAPT